MIDIMMMIGDYAFSIKTAAWQDFQRKMGWKWEAQERLGRAPAMQYIGPELETIQLAGTILPAFHSGTGQIEAMKREADQAKPLMLVDGLGFVHGLWVITGLDEQRSMPSSQGVGRVVDFKMQLARYGDDIAASEAAA